jgi:hypothetical protein
MRVLTVPGLDHQTAVSPADQPVKNPKKSILKEQHDQIIKNCRTHAHCPRLSSHKFGAMQYRTVFRRLDINWELEVYILKKM